MTRRPVPALVVALGVVAFMVVSDLLRLLVPVLLDSGWGYATSLADILLLGVGRNLVVGLGVFLVFWLVAPIGAPSSIARAIGAGSLAAVGGVVFNAALQLVSALVAAREASGSIYDMIPLAIQPAYLFSTSLSVAISLLPLTVLAAVLVREWLRSKVATSPAEEPVSAV